MLPMIQLSGVGRRYTTPSGVSDAVCATDLSVARGEILGLIGFSGAGKSTLLRMINLLERPTQGEVWVDGERIDQLNAAGLRRARRNIGMIFQQFNLLHNRTVASNVALPLEIAGMDRSSAQARVAECLRCVGLMEKVDQYPAQLSGGQKQRVAIARALATRPQVLLCDEPTSALDPHTAREVLEVLRDINARLGITIVLVSHSLAAVRALCGRVAVMEAGRVVELLTLNAEPLSPRSDAALRLLAA